MGRSLSFLTQLLPPKWFFVPLIILISLPSLAQTPTFSWAKGLNSGASEYSHDVVVDPTTNSVYMVGQWRNSLAAFFPTGPTPSQNFTVPYGQADGFVAKYSSNGTFQWAFKLGGPGDDFIDEIVLDPSGNIYITGYLGSGAADAYFSGTSAVTGSSTLNNASNDDFFVAKYNSSGQFQWVKRSVSNSNSTRGLDVHATVNAVYVTGSYSGTCTLDGLSITQTFGGLDLFLIKYDTNGNEQWVIVGGSSGDDYADGVTADDTDVYVTGDFKGAGLSLRTIGGANAITLVPANSSKEEIFLFSYNAAGVFRWAKTISSVEEGFAYDITSDATNLYLTGGHEGPTYFPSWVSNPVTSSSNRDIFVSSHTKTDGSTNWVNSIPCSDGGNEYGRSIAINGSGDLFITGYFKSNLTFPGPVVISSGGSEDVFVAGYSNTGTFKWAVKAGSGGADYGYGVSAGSDGSIFFSGSYDNLFTAGALPALPSDGSENVFLVKLQMPCTDAVGGTASTGTGTICAGATASITLAAYSGTIKWQSSPPGAGIWTDISGETMPLLSVTPLTTTDYRAFLSSGACLTATSNTIRITVNQPPTAANAGADQTGSSTCGLTSVTLAANSPAIGNGSWSIVSGTGGTITTPASPTSTFTGIAGNAYQLRWTISNAPCAPSTDDVTITFNLEPTISDAGPDQTGASTCGLTSVTLAGNSPTVGTGLWTIVSGTGGTITTPASPTSTFTGIAGNAYQLRWTITNAPCTPSSDDVLITFNQEPTISDAGPDQTGASTCGLTSVTLAGNSPTVGTGLWTIISGTGGTITTPASPTSTFTGIAGNAYQLRWTITNPPCAPSTDDVLITFNQEPSTSDAGPDQTGAATCGLTSVTMAANAPTVGTGQWSDRLRNGRNNNNTCQSYEYIHRHSR